MVNYRANHVNGHGIIFVIWNNDVGKGFCGLDELFVLVEKTGGGREHEAFRLLRERVAATDGSRRL